MNQKYGVSRKIASFSQAFGGYILTFLAIVQGLLLIPLYLSYINVDLYGYWLTILSVISLLNIVNFGINEVVVPRISRAYALKDYDEMMSYFVNSLIIYITTCVIFFFLCLFASLFLNEILNIAPQSFFVIKTCFFIATTTSIITVVNQLLADFSNATLKPQFQMITRIVSQILGLGVTVFLVINDYGIVSIAIGLLLSEALGCLVSGFYVYRKIKVYNKKFQINILKIKELLSLVPAMFSAILGNKLIDESPQLIITNIISAEMTTAYVVTKKVAEIILRLVRTSIISLLPSLSNANAKEELWKQQKIVKIILFIGSLFSFVSFSMYIMLNKNFVNLWLSQSIALDQAVILLIGLSTFVFSMVEIFKYFHFSIGNFEYPSYLALLGGVFSTCFSLIFVSSLGVLAMPVGCLIVASIILILSSYNFFKRLEMSISIGSVKRAILFVAFIVLIGTNVLKFDFASGWMDFIITLTFLSLILLGTSVVFYYKQLIKILLLIRGK